MSTDNNNSNNTDTECKCVYLDLNFINPLVDFDDHTYERVCTCAIEYTCDHVDKNFIHPHINFIRMDEVFNTWMAEAGYKCPYEFVCAHKDMLMISEGKYIELALKKTGQDVYFNNDSIEVELQHDMFVIPELTWYNVVLNSFPPVMVGLSKWESYQEITWKKLIFKMFNIKI